jgi:hypothetical protein
MEADCKKFGTALGTLSLVVLAIFANSTGRESKVGVVGSIVVIAVYGAQAPILEDSTDYLGF